MRTLTRLVLRHKLLVTAVWLVLAITGALTASSTVHRLTNSFSMPGPAATTEKQIVARYHYGTQDPIVPVLRPPAGQRATDSQVAARADQIFTAAKRVLPEARIVDYANTRDRVFVTADGNTTYALVAVPQKTSFTAGPVSTTVERTLRAAAPDGWRVQMTGIEALSKGSSNKGASVLVETAIGAIGALVVLAFVFGSFLALLPLLIAAVSILTTFLAVLALTQATQISQIVEFLVALIGLGVAIDYSLLVVTRWREERGRGLDNEAAVEKAMEHAGRAVVFSGITVAIGLLALIALPVPLLRSAGIGGVLIPLISVVAAITLLPILLATAGPRLSWPHRRVTAPATKFWTKWAGLVVRRRVVAAVIGIGALAVLAVPTLGLNVGEPKTSALAHTGSAHSALTQLQDGGVPTGAMTPIVVPVHAQDATKVAGQLADVPGVRTAVAPVAGGNRSGDTALVTVIPKAETNVGAGKTTVRAVRDAVDGNSAVIGVGGSGASQLDFIHDVYGNFPLMLGLVAIATFILLARALRSILLPLKAVILNLISLGAAYGVMVFIWQHGHGSEAIWGVPASGAITFWVPVMVFAFLFGLSMDYEVFILSRIREAYDNTGSTGKAVIEGIGHTGRLVTSAALILVLSFLAMSTGPQTDIKILATGLGAGILVDATIVRCLLVPALIGLLGKYNWWFPGWAARLLRVPEPAAPSVAQPTEDRAVSRI